MKTRINIGKATQRCLQCVRRGTGLMALQVAMLCAAALPCYAEEPSMTGAPTQTLLDSLSASALERVEAKVLFPIGKSQIDLGFKDNGQRLNEFVRRLREADADSLRRVGAIHIVGYASPDGDHSLNQRLSHERADNLVAFLQRRNPIPDSLVSIHYAGIDWEGLDKSVGASGMKDAHRVQYIIRHEPELTYDAKGRVVRSRKQQLMNLDGGRTWDWMMQHLYPSLRSSASLVCYIERLPQPAQAAIPAGSEAQDAISTTADDASACQAPLPESEPEDSWLKYPVVALRSNLLVPLLNAGLEIPLHKHWSVGVDYYYPWIWPSKKNKNCFELIFVSAEARYWFNASKNVDFPERNYLKGHSIGIYGAWGYYDIERNYHGHQGHGWSVGVDYLFSLPVAHDNLRLEFQLAAGAIWSRNAQPYNVTEAGGHLIKETGHRKNFSYFGPTKVGVSLVIPIFRKVKQPATATP